MSLSETKYYTKANEHRIMCSSLTKLYITKILLNESLSPVN